jgi:hypothetical protein
VFRQSSLAPAWPAKAFPSLRYWLKQLRPKPKRGVQLEYTHRIPKGVDPQKGAAWTQRNVDVDREPGPLPGRGPDPEEDPGGEKKAKANFMRAFSFSGLSTHSQNLHRRNGSHGDGSTRKNRLC